MRRKWILFIGTLIGLVLVIAYSSVYLAQSSISLWQERLTLAVASNPPLIVSFNKNSGEVSLISVPSETYLEVPGGFGWYRVGTLWHLGQIEKQNGRLLMLALRTFVGAPLDGWIGWQKDAPDFSSKKKDVIIHSLSQKIFSPAVSNLSVFDRWWLWFSLSHVRTEKIVAVDLGDKETMVKVSLPDQTKANMGDPQLVDKVTQTVLFEKIAQNERLPWRILNTTDTAGIGNKLARVLTNMGYNVAGVGNEVRERAGCRLVVPPLSLKSPGVVRLSRAVNCPIFTSDTFSKDQEGQLILGKENVQQW